jgi:hypothetical protein
MDGVALLTDAHAAGLQIHMDGEQLIIRGPRRLTSLAQRLLSHKEEILRALEWWAERAAITEFDGCLPREEAERLAWACIQSAGDV